MNASQRDTPGPTPDADRLSVRPLSVVAAALHVGVGVFPIAATGLLAPPWFVVVAALGWAVGAVALVRSRARPKVALLVPVATVAAWWLAVTLGDVFLGWTA